MDDTPETNSRRLREITGRLCDLDASARSVLLDELSEGDTDFHARVTQLLDHYDSAQKFSEQLPDLLRVVTRDQTLTRTFADGELVGSRFRIRCLRGQGGVGEVYEAEDVELPGEAVALKTLRASRATDEASVERLLQELRLMRKISHPNVCRVYDVYQHRTASGTRISFFTMELLDGETLASRLRRGPIATEVALPLVRQIAEAIDAAHAANVGHGDLKPGNIMLVPSIHGVDRVVVTDFGLARWLPVGSTLVTTTAETRPWGTPLYMAPEQLLGGRVTRASDIYALGVVCYEMVTGQQPYTSDEPMLLAVRKLRQVPRPPRALVPDLDPRWQAAILRCLDVDPDRRFRLATDVIREVERGRRRKPWAVAAAAALAGTFVVTWTGTQLLERSAEVSTTLASRADAERIVAVLPFAQENANAEGDALTLGLTAALTDHLGSTSRSNRGLYVIPTEEVINTGVNTPALAQHTLGASLFIDGRLAVVNERTEIVIGLNELSDQGFRLKASRRVSIPSDSRGVLDAVAVAAMELLEMDPSAVSLPQPGGAFDSDAGTSYLLGRGYLAQDPRHPPNVKNAIEAFARAIQQREQFALAHAGLGEAYLAHYVASRDPQSLRLAQASVDRAIMIEPRNAQFRVTRGRFYLTSSQQQRAILELKNALALDPDVPDARRWLARAYEAEGAIDKAEETFREAVARHPRHWSAHVQLGNLLYRQGRYGEAEESFVTGASYAPANRTAILSLSAVYLAQERFAAAESELAKGLKLSQDAFLYNNLGWVYILEGRFAEAVGVMEQAVKLSAADSLAWSSLARAYRWAGGRKDDEQAAYKTALQRADEEVRVNPLNAGVRGNRAYLLVETGRTDDGLREIETALALESAKANVEVFFFSALTHERAGNRKRALQDLLIAAQRGYSKGLIQRHPDLTRLRNDHGYQRVLDVAGKAVS